MKSIILMIISFVAFSHPTLRADTHTQEENVIRRFALLAGANDGGPQRTRLMFAHTDAQALARVLNELGGVAHNDMEVLVDPNIQDFRHGFARIGQRMKSARKAGKRLEFIFYYSGHSDDRGLLLGDKRFGYTEVRAAIAGLPADVRVAILDSCASGAFTRIKGGVRKRPFLVDSSTQVKGYAVITSSSATEVAQESDSVGASFFTHYLLSGLRGAADTSRDGRITLAEAYQHAFNETLARTETTQVGPQHPSYAFRLAGSGDLVLTDLRDTSALLKLNPELNGRLFIRDDQGRLVVEVYKPAGSSMTLGLEPGTYRVVLETPTTRKQGVLDIQRSAQNHLEPSKLADVELEPTTARGTPSGKQVDYIKTPFSFSVIPGLDTNPQTDRPIQNNISLHLLGGWGYALRGVEVASLFAGRDGPVEGVQLAGLFNTSESLFGAQMSGLFNLSQGDVLGVQATGGLNYTSGEMVGWQYASINYAKTTKGVQSAVINANTEALTGFQMGVVNYSGQTEGIQLGVININKDDLNGSQIGVINRSSKTKGLVLGVVNIADEMGDEGIPIGIINVIGDGLLEATAWTSDTTLVNAGIKMGSQRFYSILGIGAAPVDGDQEEASFIVGLGGHFDLTPSPLWLDIDLLTHHYYEDFSSDEDVLDMLGKLRGTLGWQLADHLSVYAGISVNFLISERRRHAGPAALRLWSKTEGDYHLDLGLGFILGIQI